MGCWIETSFYREKDICRNPSWRWKGRVLNIAKYRSCCHFVFETTRQLTSSAPQIISVLPILSWTKAFSLPDLMEKGHNVVLKMFTQIPSRQPSPLGYRLHWLCSTPLTPKIYPTWAKYIWKDHIGSQLRVLDLQCTWSLKPKSLRRTMFLRVNGRIAGWSSRFC